MKRIILFALTLSFTLTSCKKNTEVQQTLLADNFEELQFFKKEEYKYIITEVEVDGVKVGDKLSTHKSRLTSINGNSAKFILENNNKEKIGYVYLDTENSETIEMIEITSPKYKTLKGISVGNTFKQAKQQYPESETHGNNDKKTILMVGDYHFLLEGVKFENYTVDETKIPADTKISKIIIRK